MNFRPVGHIASVVAAMLLVTSVRCAAGDPQFCAGLFNSPKGFGVSVESGSSLLTRFTVYADIYGMPSGRQDSPGVKLDFGRYHSVRDFGIAGIAADLYIGPGVSLGWVHDLEHSVASKDGLVNNPGFAAALSGTAGLRFSFPGKSLEVDCSFTGEAGFFIRRDEFMDNLDLTLYKAGLHQVLYPQIILIKKFR